MKATVLIEVADGEIYQVRVFRNRTQAEDFAKQVVKENEGNPEFASLQGSETSWEYPGSGKILVMELEVQ